MLLAGTANLPLAREIAENLGVPLGEVTIKKFSDGEIFVRIDENVRGRDVFIVQSTTAAGGQHHGAAAAHRRRARRASAARIKAVMPYFGYARQDRKDQPRVAIGAKLMANLVATAGADRVLSVDFHPHQIQGFFDIPVDHLYAAPVFTSYFREKHLDNLVVVSPDVGSAKMARGFAKRLDATFGIIDKRRPAANVAEVMNVIGDVDGTDCLLPDDMIDTAGTMAEAAPGAQEPRARTTSTPAPPTRCSPARPWSGCAMAPFKEIVVTDTVPVPEEKRFPALTVLSVGELLARAIRYTHSNESVSSLFE